MIQIRQNEELAEAEVNALAEFGVEHPHLNTGENGKQLINYLVHTWKVVIDRESLEVARTELAKANLLESLSPAFVRLRQVHDGYPKAQFDAFNQWFEHQKTLINRGDEGFENAANLLTELRGRDISAQTIQAAIGRLQYRGVNLHWAQAPKSDRSPEFRMGLRNHAADAPAHRMGELFSKDDVDTRPYYERVGHKADQPDQPQDNTPARPPDAWTTILERYRGAGRSHAQREQIAAIYNGHLQPREKVARIERILNPQLFQATR